MIHPNVNWTPKKLPTLLDEVGAFFVCLIGIPVIIILAMMGKT